MRLAIAACFNTSAARDLIDLTDRLMTDRLPDEETPGETPDEPADESE